MTRRWLIPVTVIFTIVVVFAIIVLAGGSSGGGGTTGNIVATTNVNELGAKVDDRDPNESGCSPTGEYLPGISVPVIAPNGTRRGELVLRRSTACQAIWGRANGLEGHGHYLVEIDLYRPIDHKQIFFHVADSKT